MDTILDSTIIFWFRYDIFFYAAILSSIAAMFKGPKSELKIFKQFNTSFFVSLIFGIVVMNLTEFNKELIFVCSAISGYFAIEILHEIKEVVDNIGEILQEFFRNKLGLGKKK